LLPDGVRLVVSTRPELLEHSGFAAKFGADRCVQLEVGRLSDTDVRALLYQVRSKYVVLEAQQYLDAVLARSEGSPLYLRMLLEELVEGRRKFGDIDDLPRGVVAYFERILEFMESEGRTRDRPDADTLLRAKRETLETLAAQRILTAEQVQSQMDRERASLAEHAGLRSVELLALYCLAREPLALGRAAVILGASGEETQRAFEVIRTVLIEDGRGRFALFHTGFRDYFLRLSGYADSGLQWHAATTARVRQRLLDWCRRWPDNADAYALRHFAEHLRDAGQVSELYDLARNSEFLRAQADGLPQEPTSALLTLQTALIVAAEEDDGAAMGEFSLAHARRLAAISQRSPLDALRAGNLQLAWALAELTEAECVAAWHLLLAWELHEAGRLAEARATLTRLDSKALPCAPEWLREAILDPLSHAREVCADTFRSLRRRLLDDRGRSALCNHLAAHGLFAEARETAEEIGDTTVRSLALRDIAMAQGQTSQQDLTIASDRLSAFKELTETLVQTGRHAEALLVLAKALATTDGLEHDFDRAWWQQWVGLAQARAGDARTALQTITAIADERRRAEALQELVWQQEGQR
jgi:hypothetical protein